MAIKMEALLLFLFIATSTFINGEPQVPCYFIFGDSLMDNGNNNGLITESKVNFPPYGIDFPLGPTGRFTNGRNIADVVAELLGFEGFIPPFATAKGDEILKGVNYASGSGGIRDESGQHMGARISFNKQLINHQITMLQLSYLIGEGNIFAVKKYLNKCIYTVGMGNNDYINNYFRPEYYKTSRLYTPEKYAKILVQQYSHQLQKLYKYGARKFGIFGAGYLGCTPGMMTLYGTNSTCVDEINNAVILFNTQLNTTLNDLNNKLPDAKFIMLDSPLTYPNEFNVTTEPCCEVLTSDIGKGNCVSNQIPCKNRQNYIFWDSFHPTEAVNVIDGTKVYESFYPFYAPQDIASLLNTEEGYITSA